jgi:hemerythrin superfamily protein
MATGKVDLLSQIIQYHENTAEIETGLASFIQAYKAGVYEDAYFWLRTFYDRYVVEHFNFEETIVFPALVQRQPSVLFKKKIAGYLRVHQTIYSLGLALLRQTDPEIKTKDRSQAKKDFIKFKLAVTAHAQAENREIVPLVEGDAAVRFLMGKSFIKYRKQFARYRKN